MLTLETRRKCRLVISMQLTFIIKSFQDLDAGFMSLKLQNVGMGGVGMCILQD